MVTGQVLDAFDEAPRLCAYNSVLFDIPFISRQLHVPVSTVHDWLMKLCDPFHAMKTSFDFTCKLDKLLALNNLQCKSASGLQAIQMAKNGEWDALVSYCMDDVRLTAQLCELPVIYLFNHVGMNFFFVVKYVYHELTKHVLADGFWVCCSYKYDSIRFFTVKTK
jgi:hypothetical protein